MPRKIKVLVVPSDRFGVFHYRSAMPHIKLDELYGEEFDVEINHEPNWEDLRSFDKYDIVHFHKGLFNKQDVFWRALDYFKENNIVTVMDIDDHWKLSPNHPMYYQMKYTGFDKTIVENLRRADYVTTTTEIFADKIRPYNKNVFVYQNAIDPNDGQYQPIKNPSDRIRFGFVMGSAHEKDMEQFIGVINALPKDVLDKIQVVLCGFDLRGNINVFDSEGKLVNSRQIKPTESVWFRYENVITDNYKIISPEYRDFLFKFLPNAQWDNVVNEPYRREWTMDIHEYGKHYRNIDVLFAPLAENEFNEVKSELKFIEAGFTRTAVIATNFGPYTIGSKNMFKFGGEIDMEGNCVLIDPAKKHKAWAQAIKKLVANTELITTLQNNMYEHVKEKYDINNVTKRRAEWYKSICRK